MPIKQTVSSMIRWFDTDYQPLEPQKNSNKPIDWIRVIPFLGMHLACLAVFWVGWSEVAVFAAVLLYAVRMFAVTGIYHRYFSHKSYRTSRFVQFLFGVFGASAVQRGPLWWASHHRYHHLYSDTEEDLHSPRRHGFIWAHIGWIISRKNFKTDYKRVPDLAKFPELVLINRFDILMPIILGFSTFYLGKTLHQIYPALNTSGPQMLVWGFFISTIVLFHATSTINSLAHLIGKKRFETDDDSKNSLLLSLLTFGEGWHNNHHYYQSSVRQGFYWWEIDITYYVLFFLSRMGVIWNLQKVPSHLLNSDLYEKSIPKKRTRTPA